MPKMRKPPLVDKDDFEYEGKVENGEELIIHIVNTMYMYMYIQ